MSLPRPDRSRLPYLPALDGLRGIALVAILLAHGGVDRVRGGHLALTAFFTLSGFLITALLLVERHTTGTVDLRQFWTRRARRLVPALLVCFPLIAAVVLLADTPPSDGLLLDAVAAATWVANWRFVLSDQSYADVFALPSPFQHFWSLAVEEQFYVVFPLLLLLVLGVRRARPRTGRLALLLGVLVVASTLQLAHLHAEGGVLGRAYYGTDARVAEILVGSLLALALVGPQGLRRLGRPAGAAVDALGVVGLGGLLVLALTLDESADLTYRGGFLLAACCTAAVVASGVRDGSPVHRLLSARPLVQLGLISYGVYLFHWPLFLLLTETQTGLSTGPLLVLRLAVVLTLAWLSHRLLEMPVRRNALPALPAFGGWATGALAGVVIVTAAGTAVTLPQVAEPDEVQAVSAPGLAPQPAVPAQEPVAAASPSATPPPPPPAAVSSPLAPRAAPAPRQAPPRRSPPPTVPPPSAPKAASGPRPKPAKTVPPKFVKDPTDEPVPTVPPRVPGRLRVAIVGDSIAGDLGTGLARYAEDAAADMQVVSFALGGCPVTRGEMRRVTEDRLFPVEEGCSWWADRQSDRWRAFTEYDPHLVLLSAGIDEAFDRKLDQWDDWLSPGDPRFDEHLVQEYRFAVGRLTSLGAEVMLADAPCADWDRYEPFRRMRNGDLRIRAVNLAYQRLSGVRRLDLNARVCPGGQYSDDVEGVENGRYDGFHFTVEAQDALARNWHGPLVEQAAEGRPRD